MSKSPGERGFDSRRNNIMRQNLNNRLSVFISKRVAHTEAWRQSMEAQKQVSANGAKNSAKNLQKHEKKIFS